MANFHARHGEPERRVLISGMGVITPNGQSLEKLWSAIREGRSAAGLLTRFDNDGGPCRLACEINDFNATDYMDAKTAKRIERSLQFGVAAARLAMSDANIDFSQMDADRTGVAEATS